MERLAVSRERDKPKSTASSRSSWWLVLPLEMLKLLQMLLQMPPSPPRKRVSQANRHRRPWNYSISNLSTIVGAHSERSEKSCEEEMESRNATASEVEKEVLVVWQDVGEQAMAVVDPKQSAKVC